MKINMNLMLATGKTEGKNYIILSSCNAHVTEYQEFFLNSFWTKGPINDSLPQLQEHLTPHKLCVGSSYAAEWYSGTSI